MNATRFARQRWRAWIETFLKRAIFSFALWFARQRWRAWIETSSDSSSAMRLRGSPVSDGGRGLKHEVQTGRVDAQSGSPVSDGGRGLKPRMGAAKPAR